MTHVFRGTENNERVTDRFARRSTQRYTKDAAMRADERGQHTLRGNDDDMQLARTTICINRQSVKMSRKIWEWLRDKSLKLNDQKTDVVLYTSISCILQLSAMRVFHLSLA